MFLQTQGNKQTRPFAPKPQALPVTDTALRDAQHVLVLRLPTSELRKERRKRQTSGLFNKVISAMITLSHLMEQKSKVLCPQIRSDCMAQLMATKHTLDLSLLEHPPYRGTRGTLDGWTHTFLSINSFLSDSHLFV